MFIKIVAFVKKCLNDKIADISAQISYYLILAFFPAIIFIISLISMNNLKTSSVLVFFETMMPGTSYEIIEKYVSGAFDNPQVNILSLGVLVTVYSASRGVRSLMRGLNKIYDVKEKRNFFKRTLLSVFFIIGLGILIVISLGLVVLGENIGKGISAWMNFNHDFQILWNAYRIVFALFIMFLVFLVIYFVLPAKKVHIYEVVPGSVVATLGWISASLGFSFYVNNMSKMSDVYGGLWSVIIFMLWIYLTSLVILIGGEVNNILQLKKNALE